MFRELDYRVTKFGELILRKRSSPSLGGAEVYEVLLDGEYLMSSHVNQSEIALAEIGIAAAHASEGPILIGGLGLGYTAAAALDRDDAGDVEIIEALPEVIAWHRQRLVPLGERLSTDPSVTIVQDDFFARIAQPPSRRFRSILVDIDHSPEHLLHADHGSFYEVDALAHLASHLVPGGSFALWSADPPHENFLSAMRHAFARVDVHTIEFDNPHTGEDRNWIIASVAPFDSDRP